MNEPQPLGLDFVDDDTLAGFRLTRLQVFNWGTFDGRVWTLHPDGRNSLLTGDIGSGKSTLVDAVTTLLVPAHRVAYNKAAGADNRERSLRSYVLGYYKSERNETSGKARPVALRDTNSYSVILGEFRNQGYDQTVTLAQVFWMKDLHGQPERFYVGAERALDIAQEFSGFGSEIKALRKQLRDSGAEVMDRFPQYGAWFRRRFGIDNEQALDLFHQTVSMKSVGNLTGFVRGHMLEPFDVAPRIKALIEHFDDLNRSHDAVLKAKRQISLLQPLVDDCDAHGELTGKVAQSRRCRDALTAYISTQKFRLLGERVDRLQVEHGRLQASIGQLEDTLHRQQAQYAELRQQVADNGGDRIERIAEEIRRTEHERENRQRRAARYAELLDPLDLHAPDTEADFIAQRQVLQGLIEQTRHSRAETEAALREDEFTFRKRREEHAELQREINGLKSRRSNIDQAQIEIRALLCAQLGLEESDMPFAGELLQVREGESPWQGAIERLLRSFGLSLLVPDEHYSKVADWVEHTHLRGRLVYYRVREPRGTQAPQLHPQSLVHKLAIKPDSGFYAWLEEQLARRFDLACCDDMAAFRREAKAISRGGQIKSGGQRHEKDDRHRIDDRSRYILGWSNREKINALQDAANRLETVMGELGESIGTCAATLQAMTATIEAVSKLEEYNDFNELDWRPLVLDIERMKSEKQELESTSDLLRSLTRRLQDLEHEIDITSGKLEPARDARARTDQKREDAERARSNLADYLASPESRSAEACFAQLEMYRADALGEHTLSVESCDNREQDMRNWLQARIDAQDKRISSLQERIVRAMSGYQKDYPLETQEVDVAVQSAGDYRAMLQELESDGLPRFEARFKTLLNENTINEVANFQSQLHRERETIRERIAQINESLTQIDYNPGRYILLEAQPTQDADIRDFQTELRKCTDDSLSDSEGEQYSEAKFLQVRQIIERFRGREGLSDQDRRWTAGVTDVRNWFSFAASERWREDDTEHEHYSDSGGKSGGQKEKLAYTILAASLAYQFGLEWGAVRSRSFRFVVIDEAFGRGSDESTEYGLKLFDQLNLQLLIVTPLQKIHIIEPHVASVGFVQNEDGRTSRLRNLSIKEYRSEKARQSAVANKPSQ